MTSEKPPPTIETASFLHQRERDCEGVDRKGGDGWMDRATKDILFLGCIKHTGTTFH
jgi:hypothetical protein